MQGEASGRKLHSLARERRFGGKLVNCFVPSKIEAVEMRGIVHAAHFRQRVKTEQTDDPQIEGRRHCRAPNFVGNKEIELVRSAAQAATLATIRGTRHFNHNGYSDTL